RRVRVRPPRDPVRPRHRGEGAGPRGRSSPRTNRDAERRPRVPALRGRGDPGSCGRGGPRMTDDDRPTYAYYPAFRAKEELRGQDSLGITHEAEQLFKEWDERVHVRGIYSTVAFRTDADLMMWWVARSPDDVQELLAELRRTPLGRGLEQTHAFLGV